MIIIGVGEDDGLHVHVYTCMCENVVTIIVRILFIAAADCGQIAQILLRQLTKGPGSPFFGVSVMNHLASLDISPTTYRYIFFHRAFMATR